MDLGFLKYSDQFTKKDLYQLTNWTRHSIKKAHHIITISKFTKNQIIKLYNTIPNKITIAYPGISIPPKVNKLNSLESFKNLKLEIRNYFLYLGTLKPSKNISFLIKSFAKFLQCNPELIEKHLVIAGKKGWFFQNIFSLVKKLNLQNKVIFTDYITEKEKWILLKNTKTLIIPSLYEGFGIPAIEAQKLGTPVLSSNIPVLKEILHNSALFFNPKKQDQLVNAMQQIHNPKIHKKYSKLGLKNSKPFNWNQTSQQILQVFRQFNP